MKIRVFIWLSYLFLSTPFALVGQFQNSLFSKYTGVDLNLSQSIPHITEQPHSSGLILDRSKRNRSFSQANPINHPSTSILYTSSQNSQKMNLNRRLKYSSIWAFTSLNYLYADLVGIMDMNLLNQYQTGVVNGVEITPVFLTAAAAYMQIPLANVFLPHVIKNDNTLRWIQIISGSIATIVQGATLFVGEPTPYYILFSAIEMGATAYLTFDAIKWKTNKHKSVSPIEF